MSADANDPDLPPMRRALDLAASGLYTTDPNPRVGCVLVRGGEVVGEAWHARAGEPHAEALALRAAGGRARGATAYITLEPCCHTGRTPPCADALVAAGIARVVCAVGDPNPRVDGGGIARLRAAGIEVAVGLCGAAARGLNPGFFSRFERRRPFVRLKLAMSLDARTAPAGVLGRTWITGPAAREDVQHLRARSSAVLTGSGTIRIDDPRLDVRLSYGPWVRQPLRVVLDTNLASDPAAAVFKDDDALVFAAVESESRAGDARAVERVARTAQGLDLHAVLGALARREINEVLVESGAHLAASFLDAQLVDEVLLYVAPGLLGADAVPLTALRGEAAARALADFEFRDQHLLPPDLRLTLAPKKRD